VVFVCEHNRFAELTPSSTHIAGEVYRRAEGYGLPGVRVDGGVVRDVAREASTAVGRARSGAGPTLLEVMTYRWSGHYVGDPAGYRDEEEAATFRDRDPVAAARAELADDVAEWIDTDVERRLAAAVARALAAPTADPEDLG
jgi:TPP-dependent pyruvate/acetoin dehydrogenase alpha subunit